MCFKITEFAHGTGGFTEGMELTGLFEVKNTFNLHNINEWAYNNTHQGIFSAKNNLKIEDFVANYSELVVFHLDFSQDIENFMKFLHLSAENRPKCIILVSNPDFLLNLKSNEVINRVDGTPTTSQIAVSLNKTGFHVYQHTFDEADFGVPQHKRVLLTIGFANKPQESDNLSQIILNNHILNKTTVFQSISDLKCDNNYLPKTNKFQSFCRNLPPYQNLSWQVARQSREAVLEKVRQVKAGHKLSDIPEFSNQKGYRRFPKYDTAPELSRDFMYFSSRGCSIHPFLDRSLTIREACRLFGLRDTVTFDQKFSIKEIAETIYLSCSPLFGAAVGGVLAEMLK